MDSRKVTVAKNRFAFWLVCKNCDKQGHKTRDCKSRKNKAGEFMSNATEYEDPNRTDRNSVDEIETFKGIVWNSFIIEDLYKIPIDQAAVYEIAQVDSDGKMRVLYLGMSGCVRERMLDHHFGRRLSNIGKERSSNIREYKKDAISKGFVIFYRFRIVSTRNEALALESSLLDEFNYPWNIDENGKEERLVI